MHDSHHKLFDQSFSHRITHTQAESRVSEPSVWLKQPSATGFTEESLTSQSA